MAISLDGQRMQYYFVRFDRVWGKPMESSIDAYRNIVEKPDENWVYRIFAFALFEERRIEWMRHFEKQNGRMPEDQEISDWYRQQPDRELLHVKGKAETALQEYARNVLQEILDEERKQVADSVIVDEIRIARRFWPQFGINVLGGLTSALLLALTLAILAIVVFADSLPVGIGPYILER